MFRFASVTCLFVSFRRPAHIDDLPRREALDARPPATAPPATATAGNRAGERTPPPASGRHRRRADATAGERTPPPASGRHRRRQYQQLVTGAPATPQHPTSVIHYVSFCVGDLFVCIFAALRASTICLDARLSTRDCRRLPTTTNRQRNVFQMFYK
jgi:hypothetical protein